MLLAQKKRERVLVNGEFVLVLVLVVLMGLILIPLASRAVDWLSRLLRTN